jgi:hypothetical protein
MLCVVGVFGMQGCSRNDDAPDHTTCSETERLALTLGTYELSGFFPVPGHAQCLFANEHDDVVSYGWTWDRPSSEWGLRQGSFTYSFDRPPAFAELTSLSVSYDATIETRTPYVLRIVMSSFPPSNSTTKVSPLIQTMITHTQQIQVELIGTGGDLPEWPNSKSPDVTETVMIANRRYRFTGWKMEDVTFHNSWWETVRFTSEVASPSGTLDVMALLRFLNAQGIFILACRGGLNWLRCDLILKTQGTGKATINNYAIVLNGTALH